MKNFVIASRARGSREPGSMAWHLDGLHEFVGETGTAAEKLSETFRSLVHSMIIGDVTPKAPLKAQIFGKLSVLNGVVDGRADATDFFVR